MWHCRIPLLSGPEPHESTRLGKVVGRTDDMLIVWGVNVFSSQTEGVLVGIPRVGDRFQVGIDC